MNQLAYIVIITLLSLFSSCKEDDATDFIQKNNYETNEEGTYQDFLTPNYYNTNEIDLREDINKFVHYVRLEDFQNPFQNSSGEVLPYSIKRKFGDGIGMSDTSQHHPAIDLYPTSPTDISIYAAHEGIVNTYRDSPKYRHYLTITKEIIDSDNHSIGKLVSIYAHIDLDLDESESIQLNGLHVKKGDLVSENLYSGTMGGSHLHFEIRYYRNSDIGNEEFYNWQKSGVNTKLSSGIWLYGYWNPNIGYGFGNPINHGVE